MKTHDKQTKKTLIALFVGLLMIALPQASLAQKANIDVDLLSEIIVKKQEEVKTRLISNLVTTHVTTTNSLTYSTLYQALNVLTQEKNKTVLTRDLTWILSDYAIVSVIEVYFYNTELKDVLKTQTELLTNRNAGNPEKIDLVDFVITEAYSENKPKKTINKAGTVNTNDPEVKFAALLHNYLIDSFYTILSNNPWLKEKGFFKEGKHSGLIESTDYSSLESDVRMKGIREKMASFANDLETKINGAQKLDEFLSQLGSIQDLGKLKTEQAKLLLELMQEAFDQVQNQFDDNIFAKQIFDIIETYIIIDLSEEDIKSFPYKIRIDVEAVIWTLAEKFDRYRGVIIPVIGVQVKPFFTIGLNQGRFLNTTDSFQFENETKLIKNFSFASEKIGMKLIIYDYKYTHSFGPNDPFFYRNSFRSWKESVVKDPLVSNLHLTFYGSGILYNIVNLKSEKNFKYAIAGAGAGVRFYNGLEMNISYAIPLINNQSFTQMNEKAFLNFGFDIPVFEYLAAARD